MKWIFLLVVIPFAIVAQDNVIEDVVIGPMPIMRKPPRPPPIDTTTAVPRIAPKNPWIAVHNGIILKGFPFNVAIRRFGSTSRSVILTLTLAGTSESGSPYTKTKYANVKRGSTSDWVSFDTSKIPRGTYSLKIEGGGYEEKRQLTYSQKDSAIMVQLEKAIYSPGQTVQFRIFAVDALTNAASPSSACSISIRDAYGNLVEGYENLKFLKGKYENKLILGDKAVQGIWAMQVTCGNEQAYEEFEVAEYKLPPFEVIVTIPSETPYSSGNVPVQIKATYSFGKPVDGTGSLEIYQWGNPILTKEIVITGGEKSFDLGIATDLNAASSGWFSYSYKFTLRDSIMNQEVTANSGNWFSITPYKYSITVSGSQVITPGSAYSYSVSVASQNNEFPPQGTKVTVTIYHQSGSFNQELTLDKAGSAKSSFTVPSDTTYISIQATAPESNYGYLYAYNQAGQPGSVSLFPNYRGEESAKLNEWLNIKAIVSDKNVDWIAYFVVSKGIVLESQRVSFKSKSRSASIWVKPTIAYFPRFTVIAAYARGVDIIVGEVSVEVKGLNNFVKLSFKEVEVKPGANYTFTVDSKCDSTVSFSAIDQRVLQLKSGNEILYNDVTQAMYPFSWGWLEDYRPYIPPYEWSFKNNLVYIQTNIPPPPQPEYWYDKSEMVPGQREPERKESARPDRPGGSNDVKIRKDFSETFCWTEVVTNKAVSYSSSEECDNSCRAKVNCKVSDSITKYLVYPVSMNDKYGIGLLDTPANITAFLPFFINCDVPETIHRNELLSLNIPIFNYINKGQNVTVTITKSNKFAASDLPLFGWTETATGYVKVVSVQAGKSFNDINFDLKFLEVGIFSIKIVASGPLAGDGIEKLIRVIPEGVPRTITRSIMIVGNNPSDTNLQCEYPDGTYEDTKQVLATVIGDILGKALNNLENLIQMPGGCGEQNLLSLVPNCAIYEYLKATNKLTPAIETMLKQYQAVGVQNQLSYRRFDGSFSAFGNNDESGSTWLSIYTVYALFKAKEYVTVDPNVITSALSFVIAQQRFDGSFAEPGRVIHVDMQGGTSNGVGMTAYVSSVLTPMLNEYPDYTAARDNANAYLVSVLPNTEDVYELGIIAYALLLSGNAEGTTAFDKFFASKTEIGAEIYWQKTISPPNFWYTTLSLNIEVSSYGLLNLILSEDTVSAIKVAKYLSGQSNKFGGYGSSQDTVMALSALAAFAKSFTLSGATVDLTLTPNAGEQFTAKVDSTNIMTLQQFELSPETNSLNVKPSASSTGLAIVSLTCNFYQDPAAVVPLFNVKYEYFRQCSWSLGINVCASYIPEGTSNMAIITVYLPSGFQYQEWWGVPNNPEVSKVETFNAGTKVVFYLNTIGNKETCVEVNAWRAQVVSQLKPGVIVVNDYYDTSKEGAAKFPPPDMNGPCWYR